MDWGKTTARQDEKHLSFGIWCVLYQTFDGSSCLLFAFLSVPLAGKDKAVEVKCVAILVELLKDEDPDVRAKSAGALMT